MAKEPIIKLINIKLADQSKARGKSFWGLRTSPACTADISKPIRPKIIVVKKAKLLNSVKGKNVRA
jgi:hypothetical protein